MAQNEVGESVTVMVGPMLGGYLFGVLNALPFLFDLISYVLATAFLLFMRMDFQPTGRQQRTSFRKEMVEGVRWLWHRPLLRMMTLVVALQLLAVVEGDLGVIVLAQQQHASAVEIGLIFSAGGIGGILGALFAPFLRKRLPFVTLLLCTEWLLALFWFGYAFAPAILLLALLEAVVAVVDQIMDVVWVSYRIALIPSALQGRVNSIYRLVGQVSRPLGLFGAGVLLQKVGGGEMFLFAGLILVVAALGASVALGLNRSTI